jgi:hypothetical protein
MSLDDNDNPSPPGAPDTTNSEWWQHQGDDMISEQSRKMLNEILSKPVSAEKSKEQWESAQRIGQAWRNITEGGTAQTDQEQRRAIGDELRLRRSTLFDGQKGYGRAEVAAALGVTPRMLGLFEGGFFKSNEELNTHIQLWTEMLGVDLEDLKSRYPILNPERVKGHSL